MFINIHTHRPPDPGEKSILNLYRDFERSEAPGFYSLGIHPWHIEPDPEKQLRDLRSYAGSARVLAIGETGLDKICDTPWDLQENLFRAQLSLAMELRKPVIIHAVKAYEELLQIIREEKPDLPLVFHGFNRKADLALQLTRAGYYLSFGKALEKETVQEALRAVSPEQILLETDDAGISIAVIYKMAGEVLSVDADSLSLQLQKNAAAVFGPAWLL